MTETKTSNTCQMEGSECKRDAQALCLHCSKNLCRSHFAQHLQILELQSRAELNVLADRFNDIISRFDQVSASTNVTDKPFADLDRWAMDAHRMIDRLAAEKRQELREKIQAYHEDFQAMKTEQLELICQKKKNLKSLLAECDPTQEEKGEIQEAIVKAEKYFESIRTHRIEVIATEPIFSFNIRTITSEEQSLFQKPKRKFEVTYVRLNGNIRKYSVLSSTSGTMKDLIDDFILKYNLAEQISPLHINSAHETSPHRPHADLVAPVEIYNFRIHTFFKRDHALSSINQKDIIVFYETPYSLVVTEPASILMPCQFHCNNNIHHFRFPIYLSVPRQACKGHDILTELHGKIRNFFLLQSEADLELFTPILHFQSTNNHQNSTKPLNSCLDEIIEFNTTNTSLKVNVSNQASVLRDEQRNLNDFYEVLSFTLQ